MLSNLTAEQRNSLQAMPQVLGLAADIAHAAVTIYLPGAADDAGRQCSSRYDGAASACG